MNDTARRLTDHTIPWRDPALLRMLCTTWGMAHASVRKLFAVLVTIASLSLAATAQAPESPALLNDTAHVYSLGVGDVRCPSQSEWNSDPLRASFSWGYTNERRDYTVLPPLICEGAQGVGGGKMPTWLQAAGVWMLVHEAFHLRHWHFRRNDAKVNCQTIVYFTDAAVRLGATEAQANLLYPYAFALYELDIDLYPWHRDPKCVVPPWMPPPPP